MVLGKIAEEFVTLVFNSRISATRTRRNVRLVDDDQVRSIAQKCVTMAAPIGLYEVNAGHEIGIISIDRTS